MAEEEQKYEPIMQEEIDRICEAHEQWLDSNSEVGNRAVFQYVICSSANFRRRNLADAIFHNSKFPSAIFDEAILDGAKLDSCDLRNAMFILAGMRSVSISQTILDDSNMDGVNAAYASINSSLMRRVNLRNSNFTGASFFGVDLAEAIMNGISMADGRIDSTELVNVELVDATLVRLKAKAIKVKLCNLSRTNLNASILDRAVFERCRFHHTVLTEASLKESLIFGGIFSHVILKGADLTRAGFRDVNAEPRDFLGALNLEKADFSPNMRQHIELLLKDNHSQAQARVSQRSDDETRLDEESLEARNSTTYADINPRIESDLWTLQDKLDHQPFANAVAALIKHKSTKPPLTIAVQAPWGAGKTSVMKKIQYLLDPDSQKERDGDLGIGKEDERPTNWFVQSLLRNPEKTRLQKEDIAPAAKVEEDMKDQRATVWFNAWKYRGAEEIWHALAFHIIDQIAARLSPVKREIFWLKLQMARIEKSAIRAKLFRLLIGKSLVWGGISLLLFVATILGIANVWVDLLPSFSVLQRNGWGALLSGCLAAAVSAGKFFWSKSQPADRDFENLVNPPDFDYEAKLGSLHKIEKDLRRVLDVVATPERPLVIFVDDLDRCDNSVIATTMEALNRFLGGDFPNCIFVLGLDAEFIAHNLGASVAPGESVPFSRSEHKPLGWRYLEKMIQLPLMLPPLGPENVRDLISDLMGGSSDDEQSGDTEGPIREKNSIGLKAEEKKESSRARLREAKSADARHSVERSLLNEARGSSEEGVVSDAILENYSENKQEDEVKALVHDISSLDYFPANPREIKRTINMFRFLCRARKEYQIRMQVAGVDVEEEKIRETIIPTNAAIARYVALCMNWPQAMIYLRLRTGDGEEKNAPTLLSKLEAKAAEIRDMLTTESDESVAPPDTMWSTFIKDNLKLGEWAADSRFRDFLSQEPQLSKYTNCVLW